MKKHILLLSTLFVSAASFGGPFVSGGTQLDIRCENLEGGLVINISQSMDGTPSASWNDSDILINRLNENEVDDVYFFFQIVDENGVPEKNLVILDERGEDDKFPATMSSTPDDKTEMACEISG